MKTKVKNSPAPYKNFNGKFIDTIYQVICEGRLPLSVEGVMRRGIDAIAGGGNDDISFAKNLFTGDAIAYHPDGRAKLVLDAGRLRRLSSKDRLSNGSLALNNGSFEMLDAQELSREQLEAYAPNKTLRFEEAIFNPLLASLARNPRLLVSYLDLPMFGDIGVYICPPPERAIMVPWMLNTKGKLAVVGFNDIESENSNVIGVLPNTLEHIAFV